jgi:hypothetical protein
LLIRLRLQPLGPNGWEEPFEERDRRWPSWKSLTLSLCAHLTALGSLWTLSVAASPNVRVRPRPLYEPTEIRIGDRLYYVSRFSPPPEPAKTSAPRVTPSKVEIARAPQSPPPPAAPTPEPVAAQSDKPAPKIFIPPEFKRDPIAQQILIQPDSPPTLRPEDPALPSFRIWTALPKMTKRFVDPGRRKPEPQQAPSLAPPSFDVSRANAPPPKEAALLTLPPIPAPAQPPQAAPVAPPPLPPGNPVNIFSVGDRPPPPTDTLVVPAGNIVAPTQGAPQASAAASGTPAAASGNGTGRGEANGAKSDAPASIRANPEPGTGETVITRPSTGNFDTVAVQSSPLDLFPEGRYVLSGRPVYLVYVAIGAAREWSLYFCLPKGDGQEAAGNGAIIQLTQPTPVRAPYPTRMVRPGVKLPSYQKYLLVHGYVTASGRFRDARVVTAGKPETDQAILASLAGWEFRPADKDGVPVLVEFLLAIPSAGL